MTAVANNHNRFDVIDIANGYLRREVLPSRRTKIQLFFFNMDESTENRLCKDGTSSIYSRSPESPKPLLMSGFTSKPLPTKHDLPEINSLDHQIALARGSTIALETTRTRLQYSKTGNRLSLPELREEKLRQWERQESENRFYRSCCNIFHDLCSVSIDSSQDLMLQSHFEPEVSPVGNARVLQTVHRLRVALEQSRTLEAQAEQEWRQQWNGSRIWNTTARWI